MPTLNAYFLSPHLSKILLPRSGASPSQKEYVLQKTWQNVIKAYKRSKCQQSSAVYLDRYTTDCEFPTSSPKRGALGGASPSPPSRPPCLGPLPNPCARFAALSPRFVRMQPELPPSAAQGSLEILEAQTCKDTSTMMVS